MRNRVAIHLSTLAILLALGLGCPQSGRGMLALYVVNRTQSPIDRVQMLNQDTGELDTVNSVPVAPGTIRVFHLSAAAYSSPFTRIAYGSTSGGFSTELGGFDFSSDKAVGLAHALNTSISLDNMSVIEDSGKMLELATDDAATVESTPAR